MHDSPSPSPSPGCSPSVAAACGSDDDASSSADRPAARQTRPATRQPTRRGDTGADESTPPADTAAAPADGRAGVGRDAAPRLLPQRHPRPGDHRRRHGTVRRRPSATTCDARDVDVQLGHRGDRGAVLRAHRRQLHRPEPGDQRLRQVRRRGAAHRRRHHVRRRLARRPRGHRLARRPRRRDARHAVARQHPGRRPARLARWSRATRPTPAAAATCTITPQENADTLAAFQTGAIDGAWVPEPWATRLVLEGGGHVLVDEADLWPDGRVRHDPPDRRRRSSSTSTPTSSRRSSSGSARRSTSPTATPQRPRRPSTTASRRSPPSRLGDETIAGAWENLRFTLDPIAASLQGSADDADRRRPARARSTSPTPGIYDLTLLNEVLAERGEDPVEGAVTSRASSRCAGSQDLRVRLATP